jgi:uncharacterized protein (TIGR01777 family)
MKIVLPGGSGHIGEALVRAFAADGHDCVVLTREPARYRGKARAVAWDGRTPGKWGAEIDGADVVINLAGRTVDCRYSEQHLREMMDSRVASTRAVGAAIAAAARPPRVWLQAGTATVYAHRYDAANDEATGIIGDPPGTPALWARSVAIGIAWEKALADAPTPRTRKVALRTSLVMGPARGGVFRVLARLARLGVGRQGDGRQFVSWIHEEDFIAAIRFLIARDDLAGAINVASPHPLPNRDLMAALHRAVGIPLALPVPEWALEVGAFFMRTETELILKSRRVVPARLLKEGFVFRHPRWPEAATDLVTRTKTATAPMP